MPTAIWWAAIAWALLDWPQPDLDTGARAAGAARAGLWGALLGGAAMIAELPNSLLKRQYVLVGAWLVLALLVSITWQRVLGSAIFMYVAHQAVSEVGYLLGMRATAR